MRSCFVPNCDILCRNITKRMMFIPPKNQELFNVWKSVLPNRRELKPTDRVCERHFHSDDICKTFDHIINGVLHQIDRGKPKLRETAIPSYNLPTDDVKDLKRKNNSNETDRKRKKQQEIFTEDMTKTRRPIIKRLIKDYSDKQSNNENNSKPETTQFGTNTNIDSNVLLDEISSTTITTEEILEDVIPQNTIVLQDEEASPTYIMQKEQRTDLETATKDEHEHENGCGDATLFDSLYEDIYEVTLPNTLWGIHRDPDRTFIVFSYFDNSTCSTSKIIHLDNRRNTHIYIRGKLLNKYTSDWSVDYLTNLVSRVDEYRICDQFQMNNKCNVIAVDDNICASCR